MSAEQPTQEVENSTETVKETVQQTETGGAESAQQETVKQTETGGAESAQQETVKQTETGGAESAQQETVKQTETGGAESAQQENQVSAAVETPSESSGADATASEDAVKPSEEGAPSDNLQAGDSAVPTVTDPLLVDIDRLIEGKEVFEPTAETEEEMAENKHGKKDKKKRGKEVTIETIATAMKSLPPDEQVATVLSKYAELADNNRQLQSALKGIKKQVENISREKETMEAEHSKIVLTKARLESLCRELQKQNKLIKDENVTRLKEEEERRKEVSAKFNTTLSEISNLMKENSDKNNRLRDENQDMAGRLQDLVKQYEAREQHVEKILKAKDLQCQLAEAKLAKQQIELTENKEKMLLEKKALLEDISSYQVKLQTMSENEISLRTQLNSYMEKYEEFQTTLERSNKIFNTFKKEMDEMTKKIKKLEKETKTWKERWEGANKALLDMVTERSELEKKLETQARQNAQLQNLCRALQEQVTELRKQNKTSAASEMKIEALTEALNASEVVTEVVNGTDAVKEEIPEEVASISMISENDSSSGKDQTPIAESGEAETCTSAEAINGAASEQTTADSPVVKSEDAVKVNYLDVD